MKFETKSEPLARRGKFLFRLGLYWIISTTMIAVSLGIGILGYRYFAELPWVDSLLNASMILTGMGPVSPMETDGAKIFASFYALFSGVVFLTATAVVLTPVLHRVMHRFHLAEEDLD
jgi:hypothetical protein